MSSSEAPRRSPRHSSTSRGSARSRGRSRPRPGSGRRGRAPFRIGAVLGATFGTWFANFVPFLLLSVIVFAPYVIATLWAAENVAMADQLWWNFADRLMQAVLTAVLSAAVIFGVFRQLRGRHAPISETVPKGLARLPAVLGVALLVGLCYTGAMLPALLVMLASPELGAALMFVGAILILIINCGLIAAVPACVVEATGVTGSIARSWELTRGNKGTIFVLQLLFGIILVIVLSIVMGVFFAMASRGDDVVTMVTVVTAVTVILFNSLQAVMATVIYHDLRRSKEGIETSELAAIFD